MASPEVAPVLVPEEFTVWVGSDFHGQLGAVDRLLAGAGLSDGADRWIAAPRSALVVTGDVVDRGPDSLRLVRRLASLRRQAAEAGGLVAILEGNHEAQVLGGLGGEPEIFQALMMFGGGATLLSVGMRPEEWEGRTAEELAARVEELAPDLVPTLWTFAPYARWGDVLLVHGGPVPFQDLSAFEASAHRLWIRDDFFASPDPFPFADPWWTYREAGLGRVVFGHTPVERPSLAHDGRAVNLDTWRGGHVTLARVRPGMALADADFLVEPAEPRAVTDAPVPPERIRRFDAELPAIVDAFVARTRGARVTTAG
ncbi:MAG TPA: metallophosphoesterase [Candidatus Dormibacteraeota bacterium]|nr:metallophosphoesterase [Candidatus Dormibacteraeota bacterium]